MTIKSWFARAVITSALLGSPSLASATTAEETFAFITFGFQDGSKMDSGVGGSIDVAVSNKETLTYQLTTAKGEQSSFAITQDGKCVFNVAADLGQGGKADIKFDMTKFVGLSDSGTLVFTNECGISVVQNGQCMAASFKPGMILNTSVDPERIKRAVEYFKKEFCAGSPF